MAFPQRKRTLSFSSSILDSIYRSIDQSDNFQQYLNENNTKEDNNDKLITLRRAIMDDEHSLYSLTTSTTNHSSSSSSSDSSTFSSSAVESYKANGSRQRVISILNDERVLLSKSCVDDNKIKAAKMLKEMKKTKQQPVSPGARLTSFLNSLFQSNAKKVKLCSSVSTTTDVKSSSSRSCFRTNNCNNNIKRSVEDCKGSVHKNSNRQKLSSLDPDKKSVSVRRVMLVKEEMTSRARKVSLKNSNCVRSYREEEEDVWSCSSSDLFELPVYETTDFKTNQDIARGFLL